MVQRTPPQSKTDQNAFPVRVMIVVPERGFDRQHTEIEAWLEREIGRGNYARHGSDRRLPDAAAFYFRTTGEAHRFREAFPNLELDDRTTYSTYNAPFVCGGKRQGRRFT